MMMKLFDELNREWSRTVMARRTQRRLSAWATAEPSLGELDEPGQILEVAHGADRERADAVLRALLRVGCDDCRAWRCVLQVVMPGLVSAARRYVPGPASDDEVAAIVVSSAWGRIAEYPLDRRPRSVAANIVLDARQASSNALFKHAGLEIPSAEILDLQPSPPHRPDPTIVLTDLLGHAVRSKVVSIDDARLVALTRIHDVPVDELARERGILPHSLRRRRLRVEAAIAATVA